jgi:hypothetical protein
MGSKYYDAKKKSEEQPNAETAATEQNMPAPTSAPAPLQMPPIGDLASALEKIATVIDKKLADLPVIDRDFSQVTDTLSNEEEWKACDNALERDHMLVDENGKDADPGHYYTVIHNYPMYQSSNANENVAYVVVEKWTFTDDGAGGKRKQKLGSFNQKYRDFAKKYKTTLAG